MVISLASIGYATSEPGANGRSGVAQLTDTKVIATSEAAQAAVQASGGELIADYGSFSVWRVPSTRHARLMDRTDVADAAYMDTIFLRGGQSINPPSGAVPALPDRLQQTRSAGPQFWLVQFAGPIKDEWLDQLTKIGLQIVTYMPNNAYVVWGSGDGLQQLDRLAAATPVIQWTGAYQPGYRLDPALQITVLNSGSEWVDVTVQFYRTEAVARSVAALRAMGRQVYLQPDRVLNFTNIALQVPANRLIDLVNQADVFNVERWIAPQRLDEKQDQIVAGNVISSGGHIIPSGPGYLLWLASQGFPTTPGSYPVVDVVDDGIDQGNDANVLHPDFHEFGLIGNPDRVMYIGNCTADASGNGVDGHGNLNAGIVASYNDLSGYPYTDTLGYRIGLGVSPYGRVAGTKVLENNGPFDLSRCGNTYSGLVARSYISGANFTSNSWGLGSGGAYDVSAQTYDARTRDASPTTTGNQQMLHIFAAGNSGSAANTITSPATGKDVLSVGATENVRENGIADGCGFTTADNADDIASFSSRGPLDDGRVKPDIMAPGIHVQGPASQDPGYNGSSVCGANTPPQPYYPHSPTQTLYTWSSGTSHSTPAVAGAASLLWEYYGRVLNPGQTPSPAMLKGLLLNTPRYLAGAGAGDTLPSHNQGWGDVNLGAMFDGTPRILIDQSRVFTNTGDVFVRPGNVVSTGLPLHVTLVWTDAPGPTTGSAYVNDLNLEVTVGSQTYKGNVFSGANSITGGAADPRNNVENVFLPPGASGPFSVKVTAANLAGDGVPGNSDLTDQDFALIIYNGSATSAPILSQANQTLSDAAGNHDGVVDPGEVIDVEIALLNNGTLTATHVSGQLALVDGNATVTSNSSAYGDISLGGVVTNTIPFRFVVNPAQNCGSPLTFAFTSTYNLTYTLAYTFEVPIGTLRPYVPYTSTNVPLAIPDNNVAGITSTLALTDAGTLGDIDVRLDTITHTAAGDLIIRLYAPDSTSITLTNRRGSTGDNFINTILDDSATRPITSALNTDAPFTGRWRPERPLAVLNDKAISGTWLLNVSDRAATNVGTLIGWGVDIRPSGYVCSAAASNVVMLPLILK
jgi:subtilisin-like proprotein convertase family protein